jgi:DNA-binding transcriptional LysR family regulator
VILARREGVGLHDAILTACQRAKFTPRLVHTPSVIHTVLSYVEAGAGIGIIPDSVASAGAGGPLVFRPLVPTQSVDLVMVWARSNPAPAAQAFRTLVDEWIRKKKLWPK